MICLKVTKVVLFGLLLWGKSVRTQTMYHHFYLYPTLRPPLVSKSDLSLLGLCQLFLGISGISGMSQENVDTI